MSSNIDGQFEFGKVAFFGRGIEEYALMFALDLAALKGAKVLDCPAGPAAFAAQARELDIAVTACDPLYCHYDINLLREIIEMDARNVALKQAENRHLFHPELTPAGVRRNAMEIFLEDYMDGRLARRYVFGTLPELDFEDQSFDLVLSANLLFIYSDIESGGMMQSGLFDYEWHRKALLELVRVSRGEVRVYPLCGPGKSEKRENQEKPEPATGEHAYLRPLIADLQSRSLRCQIRPVKQRDIIGAEQMLVVSR